MSEKRDSLVPVSSEKPPSPQRRRSSIRSPSHPSAPTSQSGLDGGGITGLPPPAVAFVPPGTSSKLKVRWQKLKRRIGSGSAPSESLGDPTATTESDNGSSFGAANSRRVPIFGPNGERDDEVQEVDEVVVEQTNDYDCWKRTTLPSNTASHRGGATGTGTGTGVGTGQVGTMPSDASSLRQTAYEASGPFEAVFGFARYRVWPIMTRFFAPTYHDPSVEDAYQKEIWYNSKGSHIVGACYLIFNWVLTLALFPRPFSLWNKIQLYGLGPATTIPLVGLAAFDVPRRRVWVWQACVWVSIWIASFANPLDMYICGYYLPTGNCHGKDYMATLYYVTALPTVALFALGQKRICAIIFDLAWLIFVSSTILPRRASWARNVVNVLLFQGFILFLHYLREMGERRVYTMRAELKISFKAKQRAQINERKQLDAKRRFSSYIFHEVRVPLNTALLAVQNLKGLNVFDDDSEHAVEYKALEGSLAMMSQVLNDVLDFSRMERGGFSSVARPFSLHTLMRSIIVPLRLDCAARGLSLDTDLDKRIDELAVQAAYPDEDPKLVKEGEGTVIGDEMRLRQIIGNLVSNATKFTTSGGKIGIKTSLIYPLEDYETPQNLPSAAELAGEADLSDATEATYSPRLTPNRLHQHEAKTTPQPKEMLVVRFEISDTGAGIKASDMAENRLFSPYVQTALGREQGGKGTGLGLSLVRQIVMLSGGRLGVRSKYGHGSTFWCELPFALPQPTGERLQRKSSPTTLSDKSPDTTPGSDSSVHNEFRFVSSLRKRSSDPTLDSIDEGSLAPARPRDLSVSTQASTFRYTSSVSPSVPPSPAPIPDSNSPTPLASSPSTSSASFSPPVFGQPFSLVPHRPENRTQISSQSAPAGVTLAPPQISAPIVSAVPLASPALAAQTPSPLVPKKPGTTKLDFADGPLKVLVVDDDALTRRLMSRMMMRLGCEVETAENGQIALDMILAPPPASARHGIAEEDEREDDDKTVEGHSQPLSADVDVDAAERGEAAGPRRSARKQKKVGYDPTMGIDAYQHYSIVFLDNQMPVCSGVQVVSKLRSLGRDDLVVGVTANALLSDQEQYLESGASSILTKPVKEDDLIKHLRIADKRRSERKDPAFRAQRQAIVSSGPHFPPIEAMIPDDED
ncbi:hypothetical protein JCM10049v2_003524 [Rhodotorula toruloides]